MGWGLNCVLDGNPVERNPPFSIPVVQAVRSGVLYEVSSAVYDFTMALKDGNFRIVVAEDGEVTAELALPLAGLISLLPFEAVAEKLHKLRDAARVLGCVLPEPFLQVSFLALPVIPHLKMTDRGLFDVDRFDFVT